MALLVDKMVTDEFVADVRRSSLLPAVQSQWSDQRILDIAWEECIAGVAVPLTEVDHSFYREIDDTTLVAEQSAYDLPRYAMLGKIHLLQLLDTNGRIAKLERINPSDEWIWKVTTSGHPRRIRIDNLQIVMNPAPSAGDLTTWPTLRAYIYRRPGRFVRQTTNGSNAGRVAVVSSVSSGTVTYTAATPADFGASSVHDFYRGTPPFRRIGSAITATAKALTTNQGFSVANAALLQAGDFVCLCDESCVMAVPSAELLLPLRHLVIASIAATHGDKGGYETALGQFQAKVAQLFPAAANRLQNNLAALSLHHSPFIRGLRASRRMVNDGTT